MSEENNVIFILVDSLFSECLGKGRTERSSTPFIDSLIKDGLFANNVYSYAPYTDAATIGLYCGMPTLDKMGYFFGINIAEHNHFKLFSENGYETFGLFYPYYLLSSQTKKYINHSVYTGGFKYGSVWGGKLEYYAQIKKERSLTELELQLLEKCMDMVFDCWKSFYADMRRDKCSTIITENLRLDDAKIDGETGLLQEIEKYQGGKRTYINELLEQGMNHRLASLNDFDYGKKKDKAFLADVYAKNRKIIAEIQRTNLYKNIRNNFPDFKKIIAAIKAKIINRDSLPMRYIINYGMLLSGCALMKKRSLSKKDWQEVASMNAQIDALFSALKKRDASKSFYASLHVLEPHHNMSFFSFDSFDQELVKEEFDYLKPLVKNCGKNFRGNLLYQLSLCYVDLCVKRLFMRLEKEQLLDKTTVVIVADHGTSYAFSPVRTQVVNTFHKENYKIPLLIWQKNLPKKVKGDYANMYSSEDILPTLCKVVGIEIPESYKGIVIYEEKSGRPYVITEYMGPGVPDMISRDIWISIRNSNYLIAYKNNISEMLEWEKPTVIYDLKKDCLELKNLSIDRSMLHREEVLFLVQKLVKRYDKIKSNTKYWQNRLEQIEI